MFKMLTCGQLQHAVGQMVVVPVLALRPPAQEVRLLVVAAHHDGAAPRLAVLGIHIIITQVM